MSINFLYGYTTKNRDYNLYLLTRVCKLILKERDTIDITFTLIETVYIWVAHNIKK